MNKFWSVPFLILLVVSILGIMMPESPAPAADAAPLDAGNVAWMLCATALVLLMTPGLAFFYGGMVSVKNVVSTMLQSFICMGVVSLLWIVVGFSLAFGDDVGGMGLIGNPMTFFMFNNVGAAAHPAIGSTVPLLLF